MREEVVERHPELGHDRPERGDRRPRAPGLDLRDRAGRDVEAAGELAQGDPAALALGPQPPRDVVVDDAQGAPRGRPLGHARSLGRALCTVPAHDRRGRGRWPRAASSSSEARAGSAASSPRSYAARGRDVVLTGRDEATAQAVAAEIGGGARGLGARPRAAPGDRRSASPTSARSTTSSSPRSTATRTRRATTTSSARSRS